MGKRLAAVGVTLARADRDLLCELLTDAWEQKVPRRLVSERYLVGLAAVASASVETAICRAT